MRYCKECGYMMPEKHFDRPQYLMESTPGYHTPGYPPSESRDGQLISKNKRIAKLMQEKEQLEKRLAHAREVVKFLKRQLEPRVEPGYKHHDWLDRLDPDDL